MRQSIPVLLLFGASTAFAEEAHEAAHEEHSPFEIRASVEAPLFAHASEGSTNITKELEPELDAMVSYVIEDKHLSLDLEIGEALLVHTDEEGIDTPRRTGTVIRPGVAWSPAHGMFVTALLPMHLEPSPFVFGLRVGAGIDFHIPVGKYFIEADVDLPLAGASGAPDAFKTQTIVLATGVLFHLPK